MDIEGNKKKPVFIALTAKSAMLAAQLAEAFDGEWHTNKRGADNKKASPPPDTITDDTTSHIQTLFLAGRTIIGICATGIILRAIGAHMGSKHSDAAVLAMTDDGKVIIPLLGGHHGANQLAYAIAAKTGGTAAITTAGERAFGIALDEPPHPIVLGADIALTPVMAGLVDGKKAKLFVDLPSGLDDVEALWREWLAPITASEDEAEDALCFCLTLKPADTKFNCVFHPRLVTLGLGASRDCPVDEMAALVKAGLQQAEIAPAAIEGVYSVDLKADEAAILNIAQQKGTRLRLFTPARLEAETPRLANPSAVVFKEVGCHGVAEAAALAAAGKEGVLLLEKTRTDHATMALGLRALGLRTLGLNHEYKTAPDSFATGRLMLVGIGPGQASWRTPEATAMIASADELVGYGFYIDLLGGLAVGKPRRDFPLGEEEARCRYALEEAAKGRDIAIICSGDAGIYAMASLVYELLAGEGVSAAAKRVEVVSAAGISAFQAAAARSGAMLGHDFCAISLSDLLTPWAQIERRIIAAAEGDFVIAFYNPVSARRREGFVKAKEMLLVHRSADTPVVLARSLGRADESISHRTLGEVRVDEIDMMTVVLIGASSSRSIMRRGAVVAFTPRGYKTESKNPPK